MDANVAAEPPHTKGSNVLAKALGATVADASTFKFVAVFVLILNINLNIKSYLEKIRKESTLFLLYEGKFFVVNDYENAWRSLVGAAGLPTDCGVLYWSANGFFFVRLSKMRH